MDKIYYQPNHLWKERKLLRSWQNTAKKNLRLLSNGYLGKHFGKYIYKAPKRVDRPHYQVTIPNEMHQLDLSYMPSDTLYGNKYKYILAGIDAASRYKVTRPLRTKQACDMAEMIAANVY